MNEDLRAAIERAVRAAALKLYYGQATVAQVIATVASEINLPSDNSPRENAKAAQKSRRDEVMAEYRRLEEKLGRRWAVAPTATKFITDPEDVVELENLKRDIRRWRDK
ncbi:hypothetical protein Q2941_43460 [Bradyrhizobium sp. UFLA05-153]